jgi:hypothetical protein
MVTPGKDVLTSSGLKVAGGGGAFGSFGSFGGGVGCTPPLVGAGP